MDRDNVLKLLLIFALAAVIYLVNMYLLIPPTGTDRICGDGTGLIYSYSGAEA